MTTINHWKKTSIWLLYIPVAAIVLYMYLQHAVTQSVPFLDYGLFLLLAILVAYFPIRTQDSVFSLTSGVSLAVFAIYGLVPEVFLSSFALLAVMIRSDIKWDQHYRYPLNLLAATILSVLSSASYYATIEFFKITNLTALGIIPLGVYMLVYIFTNQLLAYITEKYFYEHEDVQYFDDKLTFSLETSLIIIPLSFILIYLYFEMGTFGIIVGALPFITTSIVTKYYYKTKSNNEILTAVTRHAQKLAAKNSCNSVIDSFIEYILKLFPAKNAYFFHANKGNTATLKRVYIYNESSREPRNNFVLSEDSVLMKVLDTQAISIFDKASEWQDHTHFCIDYQPESAIAVPVQIMGKNKGLILITHPHRAIYDKFLVSLIVNFYQYFRVVLDNVYQFEKLEGSSYTDYLTDLPNLRGFMKHIEEITENSELNTLSLIVLDLDHFKKVNDVHGHEGGNDSLTQIAEVLREFIDEDCFIARFGGEEFIILLKNASKEEARDKADQIRKAIEEHTYKVFYSIETESEAQIRLTASLGVATYPDDTSDIHDLIKLADRAMYLGSKQSGRNKVTVYNKES